MTNPEYTAIAILVDRSGSMSKIKEEAQNSINNFIKDQAKLEGKCTVLLADFDDKYRVVNKTRSANRFPKYNLEPRNMTALHDAMGKIIVDFGEELDAMKEENRPGKVIVVVITDGHENASREYNAKSVKELVEQQKNVYGWEFIFLAANQDAVLTAQEFGIGRDATMDFAPSAQGITNSVLAAGNYVTAYRSGMKSKFTDEDRKIALDETTNIR